MHILMHQSLQKMMSNQSTTQGYHHWIKKDKKRAMKRRKKDKDVDENQIGKEAESNENHLKLLQLLYPGS